MGKKCELCGIYPSVYLSLPQLPRFRYDLEHSFEICLLIAPVDGSLCQLAFRRWSRGFTGRELRPLHSDRVFNDRADEQDDSADNGLSSAHKSEPARAGN